MGPEPKFQDAVRIADYRCIREVELQLTPLHALIGPNDSGKSSILRALTYLPRVFQGRVMDHGSAPNPARPLLRLDPDALRTATALIPSVKKSVWFLDERGLGLSGLYDSLLGRDRDAFIALEDRFKKLFPTVRALRLDNTKDAKKALGLTLHDGKVVPADGMSEGMLYWLAFAILGHLEPVEMILVEEPENGLHPSRIREVMGVLREISGRTQIVLATHSPLVINELAPEEVTIVTRTPERGTICTPMTQTKNFQQRAEVYALGELWLSYADGELERELVPEDSSPAPAAGPVAGKPMQAWLARAGEVLGSSA